MEERNAGAQSHEGTDHDCTVCLLFPGSTYNTAWYTADTLSFLSKRPINDPTVTLNKDTQE